MDGFEENKALVLQMADRAHDVAFNQAYEMAGRRTRAKFDEDKYLEAFFRAMINEAELRNRQDIKKSLLALKAKGDAAEEEAPAEESAAPEEPALAQSEESPPAVENALSSEASPEAPEQRRKLSVEEFEALSDEKLSEELHGRLTTLFDLIDDEKETQAVRKEMSRGERMLYLTWWLEAEVNNGGFDQYFVNGPGRFAKEAVLSCKLVGAKKHATLLRRAIVAYIRKNPDQTYFKMDKTIKGYMKKYKDKDFEKLDKSFFNLKIDPLRVKYIRAHPEEFIVT